MPNVDGTLTEEEEIPLVKELIEWLKAKDLTWNSAAYLLKRTRLYMGNNYNETKEYLEV